MGETTTSSPPDATAQGTPAKPRVLFIQPFAGKGGSENVLLRILESMDDRFDASVLLLQRGELADEIEARGVHAESYPLPASAPSRRFQSPPGSSPTSCATAASR